MNHEFRVKSTYRDSSHIVSREMVIAIFAIASLNKGVNSPRVHAIKLLRGESNIGLYEAKQIVDFIADNGRLEMLPALSVIIEPPRNVVEYVGHQGAL